MLCLTLVAVVGVAKVEWRGVHLFVGPNALEFQKKLWTNALLPLGYNKVVLQCEQTEWKCLPNIKGGISMKREDLKKLCDWYRSKGVEVIPLVQSFGHVQWLARGSKYLDLMMNPKVPFTVDPRKPGVARLFQTLWNEVMDVTKAKTIHFGLDEVDFRGFPKDTKLVTKLWKMHVPTLVQIAKKRHVKIMVWGDEILAPGEGQLPASAGTMSDAHARRAVLPKGSIVCDWHYQNNPDPAFYRDSIRTLQKAGFQVIASAWRKPNNVRGQALAAVQNGCGYLQTTWAGYVSDEATMRSNVDQFATMFLASGYLLGKTTEMPDKLRSNLEQEFLNLFDRKIRL